MAIEFKTLDQPQVTLYRFGSVTDGDASMKNVLGGKGANLAEMAKLGINVPSGFTVPCELSVLYKEKKAKSAVAFAGLESSLWGAVEAGLTWVDTEFSTPPLLSIRSGARVSMPGMMDTILNVGLTSETLPKWKKILGDRSALDCYRRLIQMYSSVALGVPMEKFEAALTAVKENANVTIDSELDVAALERVISKYFSIIEKSGKVFPDSLLDQVKGAILAVFNSWDNPRAAEYRKINNIPYEWGTAVTVQAMVFGNKDDKSATGVLFSRDPSTGNNVIVGEYLVNAQGEDVVAGIRTPEPMTNLVKWNKKVSSQLVTLVAKLEGHYKDMQDIEFTVESGKLYILQTRNGKRSAKAAFKIAHDLAVEGVISKEEAVTRVSQSQLLALLSDAIDPAFTVAPNLVGIAAGGGLVTGTAVFSSEDAVNCIAPCILVTKETDPDDIAGMNASVGILTATGGLTSHAAVVARGMNKSCVVGCTDLQIGASFSAGTMITIDGSSGRVWVNVEVPVIAGGATQEAKILLSWSNVAAPERLEITGKMSSKDMEAVVQSATANDLYVDTALLEGYFSGIEVGNLSVAMEALGNALMKASAESIIVDLAPMAQVWSASDRLFNSMLGLPSVDFEVQRAKVEAVLQWPTNLSKLVVFKLGENAGACGSKLAAGGWKTFGKVSTFADLLNAGGPVQVDDATIISVFGSKEAFEMARKLVEEKTGKSLSGNILPPAYWYEFNGKAA